MAGTPEQAFARRGVWINFTHGPLFRFETLALQRQKRENSLMRPELLNPLFASATNLKGVGDKVVKLFAKVLARPQDDVRVLDLLLRLPSGFVDRRYRCKINQLPQQGVVTLEVTVGRHKPAPPGRAGVPYRVEVHDDTGQMVLVFFQTYGDKLKSQLPEGEKRIVSGTIGWFGPEPRMAHPDHMLPAEAFELLPVIEPVYPMTAGLSSKTYLKTILQCLPRIPELPEWQDASWLAQNKWGGMAQALNDCHLLPSPAFADASHPARSRLAFDELLANQLALALVRQQMKKTSGRILKGDGAIHRRVLAALPYKPTGAQDAALVEIAHDMAEPTRMVRLLQGDVGAGKTLVAFMALAIAVEAGTQGALMVPTEILARQHLASLTPIADKAGLKLGILTGREKGKAREAVLDELAAGKIDILIGTHALFQDGVEFKDLGLAIIDEQHRFGVHQRMALQGKANTAPDLLVMTATPIPRTLSLTAYGDMDVSRLTEKPPGRLPIETRVMPIDRISDIVDGLKRSMAQGVRCYWVCPLVEENEILDMAAAEQRQKFLDEIFPGKVGLLHGRMKGPDRDAVMADFKSGKTSILVATTVIEVGVDVREAAIMVIENAERFGLAQLHQLRGRVGRGTVKSHCLLLYQDPLSENAKARLEIMRTTEDGFIIAEEDLRLRGAGEVLGTQQSGVPEFRMADLSVHAELLSAARDDARMILLRDPDLETPRGQALRDLLYFFERDAAVRLIKAG
jgi:ATP-dependent DNA helicase RecG